LKMSNNSCGNSERCGALTKLLEKVAQLVLFKEGSPKVLKCDKSQGVFVDGGDHRRVPQRMICYCSQEKCLKDLPLQLGQEIPSNIPRTKSIWGICSYERVLGSTAKRDVFLLCCKNEAFKEGKKFKACVVINVVIDANGKAILKKVSFDVNGAVNEMKDERDQHLRSVSNRLVHHPEARPTTDNESGSFQSSVGPDNGTPDNRINLLWNNLYDNGQCNYIQSGMPVTDGALDNQLPSQNVPWESQQSSVGFGNSGGSIWNGNDYDQRSCTQSGKEITGDALDNQLPSSQQSYAGFGNSSVTPETTVDPNVVFDSESSFEQMADDDDDDDDMGDEAHVVAAAAAGEFAGADDDQNQDGMFDRNNNYSHDIGSMDVSSTSSDQYLAAQDGMFDSDYNNSPGIGSMDVSSTSSDQYLGDQDGMFDSDYNNSPGIGSMEELLPLDEPISEENLDLFGSQDTDM